MRLLQILQQPLNMVRFYLDNWTREYGEPEKWAFATVQEMFEMQPIRVVEELIGNGLDLTFRPPVDKDSQEKLGIFLRNSQEIGQLKR